MNSCIDKMMQLLSELIIHGVVCTELLKIKRDVDINYRETELRALRDVLHQLVNDLDTVQATLSSVEDAHTQQRKDLEKVNNNTMESADKVVTLENDFGGLESKVKQLSEIYQKIKSFLANNPDIHDKNLSENIQAMEKTITALESEFEKKHKEIGRRITSMGADISGLKKGMKRKFKETEKKHQEIETKMTLMGTNIGGIKKGIKRRFKVNKEENQEIKTKITSMGKNISGIQKEIERKFKETGEKHKEIKKKIILLGRNVRGIKKEVKRFTRKPNIEKDMSEAQKERRPETDGLRQLKNKTEDKLHTLRSLKCIPTKQAEEAKTLLEEKRSIVIRGNPGEGKTTTALYLIDNEMYRDKRVVLYSPQDWKTVDTEWVDIVVLEDIFGKFDLDSGRLQEWMVFLPTIEEHLDAGKLQVIITTRDDMLLKAYSMLGSQKLFFDDLTLTLSSKQLNDSEKISILNRELQRHKKNMKEDQKVKCIANFSGLVGFPQCCLLFAGDSKLFDRGPEFFRSPCKFFVANITKLEATRFLSLAFLFCKDKIYEENLSPETMPETDKHLLMELASNLGILEINASITLLRDDYDIFLDLYVVKSMSYGFSFRSYKPCIQFTHATVSEAVGQVLGDRCPEMVVKYCDSEYLYQSTYAAKAKDVNSQNVFIPVSVYRCLAERMVCDVIKKGSLVQSVVKHSSLKQHDFLKKLKFELQKGNEIKSFFTASNNSWIINSDSSASGAHLSEGKCYMFMQYILQSDDEVVRLVYSEFLEFLACAHKNSSDCWKCQHKQMLLELALYYHHFEIADKLIHAGNVCYTHVSLCNAVKHGDLIRVQTILKALKRSQLFDPGCKEAKYALRRAWLSGKNDLIEFLLQEGILADIRQVIDAVQCGDIGVLKKVVEHLKSHNKWNPHWEPYSTHENFVDLCQELQTPVTYLRGNYIPYSTALFLSFCNEKFDMADYLLKNEVDTLMCMLPALSKYSSQNAVKKAIQNLKDTGDWDPKSHYASGALENAYNKDLYDVYNLLMQEGVSLTMKNLYGMVGKASFESIKKAIQNLKDTGNWDPKCDDAFEALKHAYEKDLYDVYNLLMQEGVSLAMENLMLW